MDRDFRYLRDTHGDAGAREIFERLCTELLQAQYGERAHGIRVTQGDGGIDILVGDFSIPIQNYQCKFFLEGIGDSQKKQIRESFQRAVSSASYRMDKWILCVPCTLSLSEFQWWSEWSSKQKREFGIEIALHEGGYIISQLKRYNIYQAAFDDDIRIKLDSILASAEDRKQNTAGKCLGLGLSTLSEGEFLGREEELRQIDRHIRQYRNPIIVYGFPGMGKTELVIEYGRRKMSACQVHFVRFEQSFLNTVVNSISNAFSGYSKLHPDGQAKSDECIFREVMHMLRERSAEDILIIDNVDSESEDFADLCDEYFSALCQLPMRLIITTRTRCEDSGIEVGVLEKHHLHQLMKRFVALTDTQMDSLINAVDAHTLTIELIARTLKHSIPRISPEAMLERLNRGETGVSAFARISSKKDRNPKKWRIEEHLLNLFRINELPSDEIQYMCNAFCIPDKGMELALFASACEDFDQDKFAHLVERGWVRLDESIDFVSVHPLIREITRKACDITFAGIQGFVDGLCKHIENQRVRVSQTIDVFHRIAESLPVPDAAMERYKQHEYAWASSEARFILSQFPDTLLIKIPYALCAFVAANSDLSYTPQWSKNGVFKANDWSKTAMVLIGMIYNDFLASPEERSALVRQDQEQVESLNSMFEPFSEEEAYNLGKGSYAKDAYLGKQYLILREPQYAVRHLLRAWSAMEYLAEHHNDLPAAFDAECLDTWFVLGQAAVESEDYETAFRFYSKCADANDAVGINNLGWMYLCGYGCEKNYSKAVALFERAAHDTDSPSIKANRHLGTLYLGKHPDAVDFDATDPEKALYYLKRAKDLGETDLDQLIMSAESQVYISCH